MKDGGGKGEGEKKKSRCAAMWAAVAAACAAAGQSLALPLSHYPGETSLYRPLSCSRLENSMVLSQATPSPEGENKM